MRSGLDGVECNKDDVLVHGKDQTQHDLRLEAVLKRLVEAGVIYTQPRQMPVKFLGHGISFSGIGADP